jgi:hypothetical protein
MKHFYFIVYHISPYTFFDTTFKEQVKQNLSKYTVYYKKNCGKVSPFCHKMYVTFIIQLGYLTLTNFVYMQSEKYHLHVWKSLC